MAYRIIVAAIVLFWLTMVGQLLRREIASPEVGASPVPVGFVLRLMFHHRQTSDLALYSQGQHRLDGAIHLEPKRLAVGADGRTAPANVLNASGSFALNLPGVNIQRVVLRGSAEMDDGGELVRVELTASLHEGRQSGMGTALFIEGEPGKDVWHYALRQAGSVLREDRGSLAALLAAIDPHLPGVDFGTMEKLHRQQAAGTRVAAHRGALRLGGETIETYVVSLMQGDAVQATVHFNQLGQVLAIKTFTGYDFYEEGVSP